ncbi:MAG: hypothetical protein RLW62_09945, partial [Gammaproteobacteria bacterium]
FAVAARHDLLWSDDRRHTFALGRVLAAEVPPTAPLVAYRLTPAVYVYASARAIPRLATSAALTRLAGQTAAPLWLLMETRDARAIAALGSLEPVHLMPTGAPERSGLYRFSLRQGMPRDAADHD